jgi:hypothetical protein
MLKRICSMYGETPHTWEGFPICGKSSCIWEDFAYMGRLPMYGKTSHIWEDFPHVGRLPIYLGV